MKKFWLGLFLFHCLTIQVLAQNTELSPKQKVVNRRTPLNKMTDYFATMGKSETEKAEILRQRKEKRRIARLQKVTREGSPEMRAEKKKRKRVNAELKRKAIQN